MARTERPLGEGDDPLLQFAAELRRLRLEAGGPTYRELSRRAHYSVGALSDAAGGRKLPSLAVTLAYVEACAGDTATWEQRWHEVAAGLNSTATAPDSPETGEESAPYVGLAPFGVQDADRFFGRERLLAQLCARVAERRLVVVVGPSGSGKTSLLEAGLVHHARTRGLQNISGGPTVVMTPGPRPLEECAAQAAALINGPASDLHRALRTDVGCLHLLALQATADRAAEAELLMVIDQFEEVFTLCHDPEERNLFFQGLHTAATAPNSRIRVVLALRADFYGHCTHYSELVDPLRDAQVLVGPMTTEELRSAISQPAIDVGCRVETALLTQVIVDATGQPAALPLVSHALLETWRRRRGNTLTLNAYEAVGGVAHAIARTAETIYTALPPDEQRWARHLFLRLLTPGDGAQATRRHLDRTELDLDQPGVNAVLERLAQARLVALDRDHVQLSHEALISSWPRLRGWLEEDRAGLRLHRQLTDATRLWESLERDPGALYRGTRLALARDLAGTRGFALTSRERAFLDASMAAEQAEHTTARRRARRLRLLVVMLTAALAVSMTTTLYAVHTQRTISEQRNRAVAHNLADEAIGMHATNPALAVQLSLTAYKMAPTTKTRNSVLSTLATTLRAHSGELISLAFHPKSNVVATASDDQTVRLWDVTNPRHPTHLATLTGHTKTVRAVAFNPSGNVLASAGIDKTTRLWDITDASRPTEVAILTGHTAGVFTVAFSPDGRVLATGSDDSTTRLWNTTNPRHPTHLATLTGHTKTVRAAVFSPGGHILATGSDDRTARLWEVTDPRHPTELATLAPHALNVLTVAFSPDGRTLATGSGGSTSIRLWEVTDPRHPAGLATLTGHSDVVGTVAFSPSGGILATGSDDRTARLWKVTDPRHPTELAVLTGPVAAVGSVAFSPDGRTLAYSGYDGSLWLIGTTPQRAIARACTQAHPTITRSEWNRYLPGLAYQPPCP